MPKVHFQHFNTFGAGQGNVIVISEINSAPANIVCDQTKIRSSEVVSLIVLENYFRLSICICVILVRLTKFDEEFTDLLFVSIRSIVASFSDQVMNIR